MNTIEKEIFDKMTEDPLHFGFIITLKKVYKR